MTHPARWSIPILEALRPILKELGLPVHDPFAGTGERLGHLCDELGLLFSGTELERPYIRDPRVHQGNSVHQDSYPTNPRRCPITHEVWSSGYVVVTSPVYPNGMTDHFHARDNSKRHTYRQGLAAITGEDRPLHPDNMGRYGNRYRRSLTSEARHWAIARQCVQWWPDDVVLNVKNIKASTYEVDVLDAWLGLLSANDYLIKQEIKVNTPGQRQGENHELRDDFEFIVVAKRPMI